MATLQDPANQAKANFLIIESRVGLTFALIARDTNDIEKRKRATHDARKAYDTACKLRNKAQMNDKEQGRLNRNLLRLKEELHLLGEIF